MTIFFIILNIIYFLAISLDILIKLFKIPALVIKVLFIILLPILSYLYLQYKNKKRLKLSYLRKLKSYSISKYKINDDNDLDITLSVLYLYFVFLICFILFNRINNVTKSFNLSGYFNKISIIYYNMPFIHFFINTIVIIYIIFIYLFLLNKIIKIAKYHFIKLYLYVVTSLEKNSYITRIRLYVVYDNPLDKFLMDLDVHEGTPKLQFWKKFIHRHIEGLKFIIHRLILLIAIIHDIFFNDLVLSNMFKILPYVFIYELWVRFCIFMLGIYPAYDEVVASLLYGEKYEIDGDIENIYLDHQPYTKLFIKELLIEYVKPGLIYKEFMPENPIIANFKLIIQFWKYFVYDIIRNKIKNKKDGKHSLTENQIKQNKQNKEKQNENQKNNDINYKD